MAPKWWTNAVNNFYNTTGLLNILLLFILIFCSCFVAIDGLWIDMNEPTIVDCYSCSVTEPPYYPSDINNITLHTFDFVAKMYKSTVYN